MPNGVYNEAKKQILNGSIDLDTTDIRVMLVKDTYVFNADHAAVDDGTVDDPASHELTVAGYARQSLAGRTVDKDESNDFGYLDANDTVFAGLEAGETIGGAVLYKHTGADNTSIPIAFFDVTDTPTNGSDITIQWAAVANGGVLKLA